MTTSYARNSDGTVKVYNTYFRSSKGDIFKELIGVGQCNDPIGICKISFGRSYPDDITYHILDTDYTNYSIVYGCIDIGFMKYETF